MQDRELKKAKFRVILTKDQEELLQQQSRDSLKDNIEKLLLWIEELITTGVSVFSMLGVVLDEKIASYIKGSEYVDIRREIKAILVEKEGYLSGGVLTKVAWFQEVWKEIENRVLKQENVKRVSGVFRGGYLYVTVGQQDLGCVSVDFRVRSLLAQGLGLVEREYLLFKVGGNSPREYEMELLCESGLVGYLAQIEVATIKKVLQMSVWQGLVGKEFELSELVVPYDTVWVEDKCGDKVYVVHQDMFGGKVKVKLVVAFQCNPDVMVVDGLWEELFAQKVKIVAVDVCEQMK